MLKLRLKKCGKKKQPAYRVVIMEARNRRDGRAIDQVGYYNTLTKQSWLNKNKIIEWLNCGVQPTETVQSLLKKSNILNS